MKEFLNPDQGYKLVKFEVGETPIPSNWIEIPEWANYAYNSDQGVCFLKDVVRFNHLLLLWQRDKVEVEDSVIISKVDETLKERQSQYGCFEDVAFVTQGIIELMNKCNYKNMPQPHQMALYMIASKMARLVNGDFNHKDSWHDIGGYAKLIENLIGE